MSLRTHCIARFHLNCFKKSRFLYNFTTNTKWFRLPNRITRFTAKERALCKSKIDATCLCIHYFNPFRALCQPFIMIFLTKNSFFTIIFFQKSFTRLIRFPKTIHTLRAAKYDFAERRFYAR